MTCVLRVDKFDSQLWQMCDFFWAIYLLGSATYILKGYGLSKKYISFTVVRHTLRAISTQENIYS